jgi:hypothetical protein
MSRRCLLCQLRDDREATPVRAAMMTMGLVKAYSLEKLEGELCERHDRLMTTAYGHSTAALRKLLA